MKKIFDQYSDFLQSFIIISALMLAMVSGDGAHTLMKWGSLSLLWGLALWVLRKPSNAYAIIKDKAFIGYLLFIVWAIFSSFFLSTVKSVSIIMLMPFIGGGVSYLIAYVSNQKKGQFFDWLLLIIGGALVLYTCYQKFALGVSRPSGLMINWNTHAALLAMIFLPWLLRYALKPSVSHGQVVCVSLLSAFFAFAMGLTLSRGAILIVAVCIFCLLLFAGRQRLFFKHSLMFIAALIVGYLLNNLFIEDNIVQRLSAVTDVNSNSLVALGSGRHLLWQPAWQMFVDKPFSGWGLGTFHLLYSQYKPALSAESGYFAHNDFLQILLELGPIGLLLFVGFVTLLGYRLCRVIIIPASKLINYKIESFIFLAVSLALLVHSFFTFHLYQLAMQIIFGYYLGRSARYYQLDQEVDSQEVVEYSSPVFNWLYRGLVVVVALFTLCFGWSFYSLEQAKNSVDEAQKLNYYLWASLFFPALEHHDVLSAFIISKHLRSELDVAQRQKLVELALTHINMAIDKVPLNASNYATKANILRSTQADVKVVSEEYKQALKYQPNFLSVRYEYAQYLVVQQQTTQAIALLWGAWGKVTVGYYQAALDFLNYQLEINNKYGNQQESVFIEQEIQRLTPLKETVDGGVYVLQKPSSGTEGNKIIELP